MRLRRGRCGASFCLTFGFLAGGGFRLASALDSASLSALDSALLSVLDSALDSALLSDSDSALELPDDVLDDADDELLVLWEELPELAEEDEEDVLPEEPAWDEDELLVEPDSLVTPLPMVMVRVLLLTLQSL